MSPSVSHYNQLLSQIGSRLLTERSYSRSYLRGMAAGEIRELVQHLLVSRSPPDESSPEEEELYGQVNQLLDMEKQRQVFTDARALKPVGKADKQPWHQLVLWKGDITTLRATAIVNAANSALLGCFQPTHKCIDNVIHCKAGPRLRAACNDLMTAQEDEEPVGSAKITPGFALPSSYIIHTVGPQLPRRRSPSKKERKQLQSCYTSSLDLLLKTLDGSPSDATIAFPCISTGLFAFPSDIAVPLAVDAVLSWLQSHPAARDWKIVFNTFLQSDYDLYQRHFETHCAGADLSASISNPLLDHAASLLKDADFLLIAAGAGLSAAAGLDYMSEEVMKKFHPSLHKRGLSTMYHLVGRTDISDAFFLGYYFKQISIARNWAPHRTAPTYSVLKSIRDHFESRSPESTLVVTSNADGMFVQEGFSTESVCTVQGDYGFIVCSDQCTNESYFDITPFIENGLKHMDPETYILAPEGMPKCPKCGARLSLFFHEMWFLMKHRAEQRKRYNAWLQSVLEQVESHKKKLVILEIGVGFNTPGVIRLPVERIATQEGVSLVRVNAEHPEIPFDSFGVGINCDANEALNHFAPRVVSDLIRRNLY